MKKQFSVCEPKISDALLVNPDIGFMAAPELMAEDPATIQAISHRKKVPLGNMYRFTPDSVTWNHPDTGVSRCGARWEDIEKEEGVYDWSVLEERLAKVAEIGCTAIVRVGPYALEGQSDIPGWLRAKYPEEPDFPFWRIDPNTTEYPALWAKFIREFAKKFDGHPVISSIDMAIVGAWGEGGGTEYMDYDAMDTIIRAYIEGFRHTPLQAMLHDPRSIACVRSYRGKIGFRVDCLGDMGGFHGERWSHMLDFYPENIENFDMRDAWRDGPIVFEACWAMPDWYAQGWDIDYIVDESLKWHISSYNSKSAPVAEEWRPAVERWVRRMGYRYEIHQLAWESEVKAGGTMDLEMLVLNTGVAPAYHGYQPTLRLVGASGTVDLPLDEDIRTWMPDEEHFFSQTLCLPECLEAGEYEVHFGVTTGLPQRPHLMLAIENERVDGFYKMGKVCVTKA